MGVWEITDLLEPSILFFIEGESEKKYQTPFIGQKQKHHVVIYSFSLIS